ncbi:hypothetical protein [Sphingomonas aerophila]|uniref:Uncharacterized protein n=1 Tax=Sphingomonas aerophila TaxID=1344948 RepID=A0A7W9BC91_9SPHN|nr:hypothetical protein [Sphingomonas aerophila]MBB5714466.1 hypothetical protein [Sphingomonas aerophila]
MSEMTRPNMVRVSLWSFAAVLLLAPAVAMRFTTEVNWSVPDFAFAAIMLAMVGAAVELFVRRANGRAYIAGAAIMIFGTFFLVWVNLAVGIIGSERNGANLLYAGVVAIVVGGATMSRARPPGLVRTCVAAAALQAFIGLVAVAAGWGTDGPIWPRDVIGVTGILVATWLGAAALFARAARDQARR